MATKGSLAQELSQLLGYKDQKVSLEQYPTPSEIASEVLWNAFMLGDLKNKTIADFGAGTGVLGIGALILGAHKVVFVEKDVEAVAILKENLKYGMNRIPAAKASEIRVNDIIKFNEEVDIILENPPFGTKNRHADIQFLDKALEMAPIVYSFHKSETLPFLYKHVTQKDGLITHVWPFRWGISGKMSHHRRKMYYISVTCLRIIKPTKSL
jgi:putative methylase